MSVNAKGGRAWLLLTTDLLDHDLGWDIGQHLTADRCRPVQREAGDDVRAALVPSVARLCRSVRHPCCHASEYIT
jgi:hypothetical protein